MDRNRTLRAAIVSAGVLAFCFACGPAGQGGVATEPEGLVKDGGAGSVSASSGPTVEIPNVPFAMFGGSPQHLNRCQVPGPLSRPTEIGSFRTGARVFASPVIGPDGTIYIGSLDGTFNALKRDGSLRWSYVCSQPIFATAAVSQTGSVYVGCDDDTLISFSTDGSIRWTYRMTHDVDSAPVIGPSGVVYVGGDGLHAVSSSGNRKWRFICGHVNASPAVRSDGVVVVGSHDRRVYGVEPDGTAAWTYATEGPVEGAAAVLEDNDVLVGSGDGFLYRLSPKGGMRWKVDAGGAIMGGVAVAEDEKTVVVGSMAGEVLAIDADRGKILWRVATGGPVRATPLLDPEGSVYVGSRDGHLYAMSLKEGEILWRLNLGSQIDSSVAVAAGGKVVVGDDNGVIHILSEEK